MLTHKWYKAWHHWALFNFDLVSYHERGGLVGMLTYPHAFYAVC